MSDMADDLPDDDQRKRAWWSPSSLLTAEAAAITAFTLAVLSLLGGSTAATLVQAMIGLAVQGVDYRWISLAPPLVLLLFAVAAMLLGGRVLRAGSGTASTWAGQLARAAVVVAALGALLSVAAIVVSLLLRGPPGD